MLWWWWWWWRRQRVGDLYAIFLYMCVLSHIYLRLYIVQWLEWKCEANIMCPHQEDADAVTLLLLPKAIDVLSDAQWKGMNVACRVGKNTFKQIFQTQNTKCFQNLFFLNTKYYQKGFVFQMLENTLECIRNSCNWNTSGVWKIWTTSPTYIRKTQYVVNELRALQTHKSGIYVE